MLSFLVALTIASIATAQQVGEYTSEVHPPIAFQTCTRSGGCESIDGGVVLDANYRWIHQVGTYTACNGFPSAVCTDAASCGQSCSLEGETIDGYNTTYGVTTSGDAVTINFSGGGARIYLMDTDTTYKNFHVLNQEFSFDVDVSQLPCGYNGALYFSEMPPDGGLSDINQAGAAYGTAYCDSQCPTGINFINGTVNVDGSLGSCCNEMDIWEANSMSTALTPHPCNVTGEFVCSGSECSDLCDPDGCDFNPFRMGDQSLYGPGATVDTTKPFTVVTQFLTDDNTATGTLVQINRIYVQDGKVISNSNVNITDLAVQNSITQSFCTAKEQVLGDATFFNQYGGLAQMGKSLQRGGVLVLSLWDSLGSGMTWLDGLTGSDPTVPGALRGSCTAAESVSDANAAVTFSNIKVGDFGSTFTLPGNIAGHYTQCGGLYYTGPTVCQAGTTCKFTNQWYSQCV